ncbi:hypothetical protein VHEMI08874 [[Torrubiella] hemipterigena]|uniref:Nephrocystin 3-like N-terminal domain-containing protein n=1 Tax=[Torrubiella] hemipterigena TaxID=1531966 RepID=A0A0A1TEV2_9HYPO|nr:hypothetical protein VHEMI08874 [[Torrubiella] hemipterigena]
MQSTTYQIILYGTIATLTVVVFFYLFQHRRQPSSGQLSSHKTITFRVQTVPGDWNKKTLQEELAADFDTELNAVSVHSIVKDIRGETNDALVTFDQTPLKLQNLNRGITYTTERHSLSLDSDFFDLTVLYTPPEESHQIDIVIVPGLGGHAFGSFKGKGSDHMWPRDALPQELKYNGLGVARIILYGYPSSLLDKDSTQDISTISLTLSQSLAELRGKHGAAPRPIIFIGHSMGGLVIKKALVFLGTSSNAEAVQLFHACRGVAYFGVPHNGMNMDRLKAELGPGFNDVLLDSLSHRNSQFLRQMDLDLATLLANVKYKLHRRDIYETEGSAQLEKGKSGKLIEGQTKELFVTATSAAPPRSRDEEAAIMRGHSDMVKFRSRNESEWKQVGRLLVGLVRDVWTTEQQGQGNMQDSLGCRFSEPDAGTCEWILRNSDYIHWKEDQTPQRSKILLIEGKPGSGKSYVMKAAVDDCKEHGLPLLCFFFDGRSDGNVSIQSEISMYKSFLFQLLERVSYPELADVKKTSLTYRCEDGKSWSQDGIWKAIISVLNHLSCRDLFIFIDAADECMDPNMPSLPTFFYETLEGRCIRLCLSARTARSFDVADRCPNVQKIDIAAYNQSDIEKMLSAMLRFRRLDQTRPVLFDQMVKTLSRRASNVFMWAHKAVKHIADMGFSSDRSDEEFIRYIDKLPNDLSGLYGHLLRQVLPADRKQTCDLLLIIQVSLRPLSPAHIRSMLECSSGVPVTLGSPDDMKKLIKNRTGGLAEDYELDYYSGDRMNAVKLMHKSVGDFLIEDAGLRVLDSRFGTGDAEAQLHLAAFQLCMRAVTYKLDTECDDKSILFLPYAVLFWAMHIRKGEASIDEEWKCPQLLESCGWDSERLLQLFESHDSHRDYRAFKPNDTPHSWMMYGETSMLVFLAYSGCTKLVTRHLSKCRQCQSPKGEHSLQRAVLVALHGNYWATAKAILEHPVAANADLAVDTAHPEDSSPLYKACVSGCIDTVDFLMRRDADPLQWHEDQPCLFPMYAAVVLHDNSHVVNAMLKHCGEDRSRIEALFSAQTDTGNTVFHGAVEEGRSRSLDLLMYEAAREPDIVLKNALTQVDNANCTAYGVAIYYMDLLERGEEIDVGADAKSLRHAITTFERAKQKWEREGS